ncbi:MAG: pseudouridine synthase [bacterium]
MKRPVNDEPLRLNRFLARAGLGSRRQVEQLITQGRIRLNGKTVQSLATQVQPARDQVTCDGQVVELPAAWRVFAFHKPLGVVSTLRAQGDQPGLLQFRDEAGLPPSFVPVGRLDAETTGLLLWTDDGDLAQVLCRPVSKVWKQYEVTLNARLTPDAQRKLTGGKLELDGRPCLPLRLQPKAVGETRRWTLELREGRRRQIRRMFAQLQLRVITLKRTAVGPIELGRLRAGHFRRLRGAEEQALRAAANPNN